MSGTTSIAAWPRPSVRVEPRTLAPGGRGRIVVTVDIPDGCHVQSHTPREPFLIPTTLVVEAAGDVAVGPAVYPVAETERFDWSDVELDVYRGAVEIVVPVEVGGGAHAGTATVSGHLRYQGCTETMCLPPVEQPIEVNVEIGER